MNRKSTSTSFDFKKSSINELPAEDKVFIQEMNKRAIEVCALLGLCIECGADYGTCQHTDQN